MRTSLMPRKAMSLVTLSLLWSCGPSVSTVDGGASAGGNSNAPAPNGVSFDAGTAAPQPMSNGADPAFLGPFCKNDFIIGFDESTGKPNPAPAEVRQFALDAVNFIRSRTALPAYRADANLEGIADRAFGTVDSLGVHGYFIANCMNKAHGYGKMCEAGWAQENYGAASGTRRTWKDGIRVPLCAMMTEPKGQGHRGNIENAAFTRMGSNGNAATANGAAWVHEFGW